MSARPQKFAFPVSTAAALPSSQENWPSLTCDWREQFLAWCRPYTLQDRTARYDGCRGPSSHQILPAGGCFTPDCPEDCKAARPKFRLLGVLRPIPSLSALAGLPTAAPRGFRSSKGLQEPASLGREGNTQSLAWRNYVTSIFKNTLLKYTCFLNLQMIYKM